MFFDLPQDAKIDKYTAGMPTTQWLTWTNPRNEYSNVIILAAGGGGSGGNSDGGSGGGGGGGGGAFGHIYCPTSLLPDTLYIQTGLGALGRLTGNGLPGAATYISLYPNTNTVNLVMTCGGGGGGGATGGGGGGGFTAGTTIGAVQGYNGNNGSTAGSGGTGAGADGILSTGNPIFGGTGGGGFAFPNGGAGGGFTTNSNILPNIPGTVANGGAGKDGFVVWKPFTVFGGMGGSNNGRGGNGPLGSGGGGAGPFSGQTFAGNGGDGFVIIIYY